MIRSPDGFRFFRLGRISSLHQIREFLMHCKLVRAACFGVMCGGVLLVMGGCGMQLETGYTYRPLDASAVQRRAYYASPYSPEKTAAQQENKQNGAHAGGMTPG